MQEKLDFEPDIIVYFDRVYGSNDIYFHYLWGKEAFFHCVTEYFIKKIGDVKHGMLCIEKGTLKYKILDVKIECE